MIWATGFLFRGTSPRTRGKLWNSSGLTAWTGNIPAHAGKTYGGTANQHSYQEHPRARGENGAKTGTVISAGGTSPRTRGKQGAGGASPCGAGNIPAHAGKTNAVTGERASTKEHPRARGENARPRRGDDKRGGTSPRTRGKHRPVPPGARRKRNIPAHAGKTQGFGWRR